MALQVDPTNEIPYRLCRQNLDDIGNDEKGLEINDSVKYQLEGAKKDDWASLTLPKEKLVDYLLPGMINILYQLHVTPAENNQYTVRSLLNHFLLKQSNLSFIMFQCSLCLAASSNQKDKHVLAISYPFQEYFDLMKSLQEFGIFPANVRDEIEFYSVDKSNVFLPIQLTAKFPLDLNPDDPNDIELR